MNSGVYYRDEEIRAKWAMEHSIKMEGLFMAHWQLEPEEVNSPLQLAWESADAKESKAAYILWLFWEEFYNIATCSLITGCSRSYVQQVLSGNRGVSASPLAAGSEWQRRNKQMVDRVMSLADLDNVPANQRFNYVSMLSLLGFTYDQLGYLFSGNKRYFLWRSAYRSNEAWRELQGQWFGFSNRAFAEMISGSSPLEELRAKKKKILNRRKVANK